MILNEIMSNALKHAFPDGSRGCIVISFKPKKNNMLQLDVNDDGIGMPNQTKKNSGETLGLKLITTLVDKQLKGKLVIDHNGGTHYRIRWRSA